MLTSEKSKTDQRAPSQNYMRTSAKGKALITEFEGEILEVYADPIGLPTFGVGHLVAPAEKSRYPLGKKITRAESQRVLSEDLARFERCVEEAVTVKINQNQFDALVSLAFNIGTEGFRKSSVLKKTNREDFKGAAEAFKLWNKAGGKVIKGLTWRRKAEADLFLLPFSGTPSSVAEQAAEGSSSLPQPPISISEGVEAPAPTASVTSEANPENTVTAETPSTLDKIFAPFKKVQDKMIEMRVDPEKISPASWLATLSTKGSGWLLNIWGFVTNNPALIFAGVALVAIGVFYFTKSKDRLADRVALLQGGKG